MLLSIVRVQALPSGSSLITAYLQVCSKLVTIYECGSAINMIYPQKTPAQSCVLTLEDMPPVQFEFGMC